MLFLGKHQGPVPPAEDHMGLTGMHLVRRYVPEPGLVAHVQELLPAFRGELANHRFLGSFAAIGQSFTLPSLQGPQGDPDHLAGFDVTGSVRVSLFYPGHHVFLVGFEDQSSSGSVERVSSFF